jgi:putative DNA primase/helicase
MTSENGPGDRVRHAETETGPGFSARYDRGWSEPGGGFNGEPTGGPEPDELDRRLVRLPLTDLGNGERFAARFGADVHFVSQWQKWLAWDETRWRLDHTAAVDRMAKATVRRMLAEARTIEEKSERRALLQWQTDSESQGRINCMLGRAKSEAGIPITFDRLDRDPWLLNVLGGTIDLRTGAIGPHRREDLITCLAPVAYDPTAQCPLWIKTLLRVFAGDQNMIRFIKQLFGISLTGDVGEQILPIFYGSGANSKSTILGAMLNLLGPDYGLKIPPGLLVERFGQQHPTELASLYGKRFVVDIESAEGARLNETLVKNLTGGDMITARRMREDFWSFDPTFKIVLSTNNKPAIKETTNAIWRRIKLVPFLVSIPLAEQDKKFPSKLRTELSGILNWCIAGCLDWQRNGLQVPPEVEVATEEYQREQDILGQFIAAECNVINDASVSSGSAELYTRYRRFTEGLGESPMSQNGFGKAMTDKGFVRYLSNGTRYRGIGLRTASTGDEHWNK